MTDERDKIIAFIEDFKTSLLIPLAKQGILTADICIDVKDMYAEELEIKNRPLKVVQIDKEGDWAEFHLLYITDTTINGKVYASGEHYRISVTYIGVDDEFAEHVRESKTPQVAHRRGMGAVEIRKDKRINHEETRDDDILEFYRHFLIQNPKLLTKLKTTGNVEINYSPTDQYLGCTLEGKGYNAVGKVLMCLRKEM